MTSLRVALAAFAFAGFAGPAVAQPADKTSSEFTGTVVTANAFQLVLRADNGAVVSFAIEDPAGVPAGLVAGLRVTVAYEATPGAANRLVGVKIASGPFESGSTTDPPAESPSVPAPDMGPPDAPPATASPTTTTQPRTVQDAASAPPAEAGASAPVSAAEAPAAGLAQSVAATRRDATRERTASTLPALGEVAALAALLLVSSLLMWAAFLRR